MLGFVGFVAGSTLACAGVAYCHNTRFFPFALGLAAVFFGRAYFVIRKTDTKQDEAYIEGRNAAYEEIHSIAIESINKSHH